MKKFLFSFSIIFLVVGVQFSSSYSNNKFIIAVLDFKNSTGDSSYEYLTEAAPEIFATNLAQSLDITVLERDRIKKILKENNLAMAGITDGDVKLLGKLLAAKQLLSGTVVKTGNQLRIDVRLTEVETGKILIADKHRCKSLDEIIDAVDILSERVIKNITGQNISIAKNIDTDIDNSSPEKDALINIETLPQNKYCLSNSKNPFYVRVGFYAKEVKIKKERLPLNISIVLDRSGSMSGKGKLDFAKNAIEFIITNLNKNDIVSIVAYDDEINVVVPPTKVMEKSKIIDQIKAIQPGGSTNLSGGLLEGYNLVKTNIKANQVNRILLISDGLANVGIVDPEKIQQIVRQKSDQKISISTFGVGEYFNEKLLTSIAEYGNANYYYINKSDKIPEIFSHEMAGLLTVVAQNCSIKINPLNGSLIENVFGFKFDKSGKSVLIKLGDIVSEEKKLALIKIIPPKKEKGEEAVAEISYSYDDVINYKGRISKENVCKLIYTADKTLIQKNLNAVVMKDIEMFNSSELMEKAIDMVDKGDINKASESINSNLNSLRSALKKYKSKELKKQTMNLIEYQVRLKKVEEAKGDSNSELFLDMQKSSRSKQYELQKRK